MDDKLIVGPKQVAASTGPIDIAVRPSDLLQAIVRASSDPNVDVTKMERLFTMHCEIVAQQRKIAFMDAMARLQAKLPQISQEGKIVVRGELRSQYARLEDIDAVIRPLLASEGFSFSFNEETTTVDNKFTKFSCTMSHKDGHSETKYRTFPLDVSDYRSGCQSVGSTTSYAQRYLIKMHLNLVEAGLDTDASDAVEPITEEQVRDLETMIVDAKVDKKRLLEYMQAEKLEAITKRDFAKAVTALQIKKRQAK